MMNLFLNRRYYAEGTNGTLTVGGETVPLCHTIELPWRDNQVNISCIPAGVYPVRERYSPKFKWHLHVQKVPGRRLILFHPANNASLELQGCIAPVTELTGPGRGDFSRHAFEKLMERVGYALRAKETIFLIINPAPVAGLILHITHEKDHTKGGIAHPALLLQAA